jgi:hypothetical protein
VKLRLPSGLGLVLVLVLVLDPDRSRADTATWELVAPASIEFAAGGSGTFELDISPANGRTISRDGPVRVEVRVPDGVTTGRRRLSLADAVDPGARAPRFSIKLSAAKPGSYQVELRVRLWLCSRQSCKPVRASRVVTVDVKA